MNKRLGTVAIAHDRKTCFGASPFWDSDSNTLVYVDVQKAAIIRFSPSECRVERHKYPSTDATQVSFAVPVAESDGDYLVGVDSELQVFSWTDDETTDVFEGYRTSQARAAKPRRVPSGEDVAYMAAVQVHNASRRNKKPFGRWKVHFDARALRCFEESRPAPVSITPSTWQPPQAYRSSAPLRQLSTSTNGWECSRTFRRNSRNTSTSLTGSSLPRSQANAAKAEGNRGRRRRNDARETISVSERSTDCRRIRRPAGSNFNETDPCLDSPEISPVELPGDEGSAGLQSLRGPYQVVSTLDEPDGNFLKTAKVDACGRLWVGSSGRQNGDQVGCVFGAGTAKVYGVSWSRRLLPKIPGLSQTSGMAWAPDDRTLYMIDSAETCVFAYDYHAKTGSLANPRAIFDASKFGNGVALHGMTIDNDGYLYIGIYGLGRVIIVDPESHQLVGYVCLPTPYVTGVTWGGEALDTLYVTSAARQADLTSHPTSGSLFQVTDLDAKGFRNLKAHLVV